MKPIIKILTFSLFIFSGLVQAQDMKIRMVSYKDCHPDLKQLEFSDKPQQCSMSSQALTFMVEGSNIAAIDDKSLNFSKLEVKGKDIRYNRKGEESFKLGSFPKVDGNGEYAIFDVNFESAPFGYISSASVDGTVGIITSEQLKNEEKVGLDLKKVFLFKAGPLTVSNQPASQQQGGIGGALKEGLQTAFIGEDANTLRIYVSGDLDAFVKLEVYEDNQELTAGWSSWSDNEKTLTFTKPAGSIIGLKLKYWHGLKRVTVPIRL